jgi:hypothetical protein
MMNGVILDQIVCFDGFSGNVEMKTSLKECPTVVKQEKGEH